MLTLLELPDGFALDVSEAGLLMLDGFTKRVIRWVDNYLTAQRSEEAEKCG